MLEEEEGLDTFKLPWISPRVFSDSIEMDLEGYLDSLKRENDRVEWDVEHWWMHQRVPGYSLKWSQVDEPLWSLLYCRHQELFIRPSIPIQRLMWWRLNATRSSGWVQQETVL